MLWVTQYNKVLELLVTYDVFMHDLWMQFGINDTWSVLADADWILKDSKRFEHKGKCYCCAAEASDGFNIGVLCAGVSNSLTVEGYLT
jgi:hypothetical protein